MKKVYNSIFLIGLSLCLGLGVAIKSNLPFQAKADEDETVKVTLDFGSYGDNVEYDIPAELSLTDYLVDEGIDLLDVVPSVEGKCFIGFNDKPSKTFDSKAEYYYYIRESIYAEIAEDTIFHAVYVDKPTEVQYEFSEVRNCVLDKTNDIQEIGHFSITDMPALPYFIEEEGTDHYLYAVTIKNQQDAKLVNVDDPNDKIDLTFYEDAEEVSNEFSDKSSSELIFTNHKRAEKRKKEKKKKKKK